MSEMTASTEMSVREAHAVIMRTYSSHRVCWPVGVEDVLSRAAKAQESEQHCQERIICH